MNFYVIKLKHIIIALLIFAVIPIIWFTTSRAVSVFNVNGREIPIYSVERDDNKIALTFDCAWNDDDIDSILDTLDKYNCKATFFVVGDWAEKYSESLKKIYDRGHEIGNHSYNHADYTKMSAEAITADLDKCDGIVLHNGTKNTAAILPKILEALECKYEFVTVSELIYKDNYVIDNTGRQFQK